MSQTLDRSRYVNPWDRLVLSNLAGGLNTAQHPANIQFSETPECVNVDFDGATVRTSRGNKKFNNQTAVRPGLLVGTRVPASSIPVLPGKSVPMMSAVYIPYNEAQDIGGVLSSVPTGSAFPADTNWATQRGRNFEINVSFRLPEDTTLLKAVTLGSKTSPTGDWIAKLQGEELDEFIAIVQKGGDRLTPMSWALGIVNVGNLLDLDVGSGLNNFGISTSTYANRRSNYALCFMWLDAPQFGVDRPVRARYSLSGTKIYSNEVANKSASDGRYPTFAYRAFIAPFFVEPGKNHHVSISLALDTGSSGSGVEPTPTWNNDGRIIVRACDDYEALQVFQYDQADVGNANLLRYKGPADSLEYFTKYGIRWWGKDPMFIGLNQRFAPWASGGFIPFGIDATAVESGGFALTDCSAHGNASTIYEEDSNPDFPSSGFNTATADNRYLLEIAHNTADATRTIFEVNQRGLVYSTACGSVTWGDESSVWNDIGVQGRCPWGPVGYEWAGLGGSAAVASSGFNPEALRGYRLVLSASTAAPSFSSNNAAGQLISIKEYVFATPAYGGAILPQHIISEFAAFSGNPSFPNTATFDGTATIRAFRWVQKPVVVSDLRIYNGEKTADAYDLQHDFSSDSSGLLVGLWRLDDGGDQVVREEVLRNDGYMMPLGMAKTRSGGVWLSGEGEALTLDLRDNPDLLKQVRAAIGDGLNGFAINMRVRLGEAYYGLQQRREKHDRTTFNLGTLAYANYHRFAPVLAAWSAASPDRNTLVKTNKQPNTADGTFSPPQPLLELSHAVELESDVSGVPSRLPMGFSLRCPSNHDKLDWLAKVPGTGSTGIHAWYNAAGVTTNRWDSQASWVGRPITVQFGFEPTGTSGTYRVYIAVNDGAEKVYWSQQAIDPRELERSIITIGGSWSPRLRDKYFASANPENWVGQGMSIWESCARMVVDSITVFACTPPGALPATSGGTSPVNAGKTTHPDAISVKPTLDKLETSPGGGTAKVTTGGWTVLPGGASFVAFSDSPERKILRIGDDTVELPDEDDLPKVVPATYYASSYSGGGVAINHPYTGPSQNGVRLVATASIAASDMSDDMTDREFSVGSGGDYNISTALVSSAQLTDPLFESLLDLGVDWRVRVYSNIGAGSSYLWQPKSVRGAKLGRGNAVRGMYAFDGELFAGSRGSLFRVDDRWRVDGSRTALAFIDGLDRVTCIHSSLPDLPQPSHGTDVADIRTWVCDAVVKVDGIDGIRTIIWVGNESMTDNEAGTIEGTRWCMALSNGRPTLSVHSNDTVGGLLRPYRRFTATAADTIAADKWTHIRWVVRGEGNNELEVPSCWIDGIPASVSVDAVATAAIATRPWITATQSVFTPDTELIVLGLQRTSEPKNTQPTFSVAAQDTTGSPMRSNLATGWMHGLGGQISQVSIFTAALGDKPYDDGEQFNPLTPPITTAPEIQALHTQSPVGETMNWYSQAVKDVSGTIVSHPFISLTHEMGSFDNQFSFASAERRIYVANGGRIGVIDV
jgi:hypothetical protein